MTGPSSWVVEEGTASSPDGTLLAWTRLGAGPPLVICYGSFSTASEWRHFAELMAPSRTVWLYERRGRGASPLVAPDFDVEAEVDDLAAIVDLAGPGAAVLGHSFGGGCALAFAARGGFDGHLVLYEPRHALRGAVSRGHIPEIERLLDAGDREAAMAFVLAEVVELPPAAVEAFRASPQWAHMCDAVEPFPKEVRLLDSLVWGESDLERLAYAPIMLIGERSRILPDDRSPDVPLRALLPAMPSVAIPGQGHFAYVGDPAGLAAVVRQVLATPQVACRRRSAEVEA